MFDGLKRKFAAGAATSILKSLATSKDTHTTIAGIIAGAILAVQGLNMDALIAGDPVQIAHVAAGVLVAIIGILATKRNADGKTTLLGTIAGALYAMQGSVETVTAGVVIAALGHLTNKPVTPPKQLQ